MEKNHRKKIKAAKKTAGKIAKSASAKKNALAMKKAGKGIFAKKVLSPALAAICGAKSLPRTEVTKKIWVYIKSHKLNEVGGLSAAFWSAICQSLRLQALHYRSKALSVLNLFDYIIRCFGFSSL